MKELKMYTATRIPMALSNLTYSGRFDVMAILDAAEDSSNGTQLLNRLRALGLRDRMVLARETDTYARIKVIDCFGNAHYLEARKD